MTQYHWTKTVEGGKFPLGTFTGRTICIRERRNSQSDLQWRSNSRQNHVKNRKQMINGLSGFNSFLLSCSVFDCLFVCLHPLLFWHHRCSSNHNSPRGIYSLPFLAPMLISPFQKHSNLPFGFIPAQFCSNTGPQCKIRDKQKENKAFSSWVDSCHTIPSTPPWTWSRLKPGVAAAYLAAAAPST